MFTPRPYQQECHEKTVAGFKEFRNQLVVMPTGSGKTCVFARLAAHYQPARTLVIAHREELIDQAIDKIQKVTGIFAQKEKAEWHASLQAPVVVASVQSMIRRLDKWPADHFGLVICDEAHHSAATSFRSVLDHFKDAKLLGVTATPDRADKRSLGAIYENIPFQISLLDLVHQGYLSEIKVHSIPIKIDLSGVKQSAGDFDADGLGDALEPYLAQIAKEIATHAPFRKTLAFLPLIATSKKFVECCKEEGLTAVHVDGTSEDRQEIKERFARGEYNIVSNAMLWTEGFDDPSIDCIALLRPTRSRALFCQQVGRGTRIAPGKTDLLLLDFLWLHEKLNLIHPAHLIATNEEDAEAITRKSFEESAGGETQEELDLEGLASEAQAEREEKLREALKAQAKRKARYTDAMEFALSMHAPDVAEFVPEVAWHEAAPSEGQLNFLVKVGIDPESVKNRGQASAIIDLLIKRSKLNLASPKQIRLMKQLGHKHADTATRDEASRYLDARFKKRERMLV